MEESESTDGGGGFLAGFLIGAIAGAIAAALLAPRRGDETRAIVMEKMDEMRRRSTHLNAVADSVRARFGASETTEN